LTTFQADNGFVYRLTSNYHFVPSTEQLYWLELEAPDPGKGKFFIKEVLGKIENSGSLPRYDYALFDCPPSFTMLSYSVLTSCDLILIPFNPDFFAADGVALLIAGLRHRIQPHPVPHLAVFANRARTYAGKPTRLAQSWIDEVRAACEKVSRQINLPVHFLSAWIPDRAAIRDAITNRRTPDDLVPNFREIWDEATKVLGK
jgi:chromosome partitioning protein